MNRMIDEFCCVCEFVVSLLFMLQYQSMQHSVCVNVYLDLMMLHTVPFYHRITVCAQGIGTSVCIATKKNLSCDRST